MPNWNLIYENTLKLNPRVQEIVKDWFKVHPDWTGWIMLSNYPPKFIGKFEILHINQLSEKRLDELGELTTQICNECGLQGKKLWDAEPGKNRVDYKFWLPFK